MSRQLPMQPKIEIMKWPHGNCYEVLTTRADGRSTVTLMDAGEARRAVNQFLWENTKVEEDDD